MSQTSLKIVIIGAGMGGLACAIACRHVGLSVLVLERTPTIQPIGAGIQIPPNACRVWFHYGLLDKLSEYSVQSQGTLFRRWKNGELLCKRSIDRETNLGCGMPLLVIHRADYQRILVDEAKLLGAEIRLGANVIDVDFAGTNVTLADGEVIKGDVIIGADGLWSTLRDKLLGYPSPPQETGNLAYRATFERSVLESLNDPTINDLLNQSQVTCWLGPSSHAVFYPVRRGKVFNLVLATPDDLPMNVRNQKGNVLEMRELFRGWDETITKIISAVSTVLKWKLCHHHKLTSWTKNNFALLGDACHPSLPYQAQGGAMAIEDGAVLGTLFGMYQSQLPNSCPSIPEILHLYESIRKERTATNVQGGVANQRMFHMPDGPDQEERDQILKAADWKEKDVDEKFIWIDVRYQKKLLGWDAVEEARKGWERLVGERSDGN
ncbi:FAD/NAD(P)-binding domain-containing protein [Zopfia rhizophila CBS 207.26]|uniref:FAD/NAD(P)-binding domain-containing protein n=1 Tax=Zopfia rhizophila CBS 207.26 TaxID=1314779 RepID=A0A6A6F0H8_9PEZI|nr:FAD/NAD(P)-binding domain-containing protein [Zopfia rhizophila CBS 207.26]